LPIEAGAVPTDERVEPATSKPAMIRAVIGGHLDLPSAEVRAAVWERFEAEVTTQEVAQVRKKLRQATAENGQASVVATETPPPKPDSRGKARTKDLPQEPAAGAPAQARRPSKAATPGFRAKDFAGAAVTVQQLSAILEVAAEAGGLRKLRESLRTVVRLRAAVGDVDESQLATALDFLAKLTGKG
jgi:hypothetical protein